MKYERMIEIVAQIEEAKDRIIFLKPFTEIGKDIWRIDCKVGSSGNYSIGEDRKGFLEEVVASIESRAKEHIEIAQNTIRLLEETKE